MMLGQTNFLAQQASMLVSLDEAFALTDFLTEPHYIANLWRARAALAIAEHADPREISRCFDEARDRAEAFGLVRLAALIERERQISGARP